MKFIRDYIDTCSIEKKLDYIKAREFFEKGCQQNEMFSLLKMVRIVSEPFLAEKFQVKTSYEEALKDFIARRKKQIRINFINTIR